MGGFDKIYGLRKDYGLRDISGFRALETPRNIPQMPIKKQNGLSGVNPDKP